LDISLYINRAFSESFTKLDNYKAEKQFKRIVGSLDINDMKSAIARCKSIMTYNKNNNLKSNNYRGYEYYIDNPSFSVWEFFELVLKDVGLLI
jgi:hypothetical protein